MPTPIEFSIALPNEPDKTVIKLAEVIRLGKNVQGLNGERYLKMSSLGLSALINAQ